MISRRRIFSYTAHFVELEPNVSKFGQSVPKKSLADLFLRMQNGNIGNYLQIYADFLFNITLPFSVWT